MENPKKGRAIINDKGFTLQIIIPYHMNVVSILMIVFLCAWLGGWFTGGLFAIRTLLAGMKGGFPSGINAFLMFWLVGWAIGLAFASFSLWALMSKEIITLSQAILEIETKALKLGRSKRYSLDTAKNFRVIRDEGLNNGILGFSQRLYRNMNPRLGGGKLAFDYGMRTVRFATGIDEPEANYLLGLFQKRFTNVNLSPEVERGLKELKTELSYKDTSIEKHGMSRLIIVLIIIVISGSMLLNVWHKPNSTPTTSIPSTNLMFKDDFDNPSSGWPSRHDETAEFVYKAGEYQMQFNKVGLIYATNSDAGPFSDFKLQIDAKLVSGNERTEYGIAFRRQDRDNFYLFSVSPKGNYSIVKRVKGEWYPLETGNSTFVRVDNSTNKLKVVCAGTEFQLFVNENLITTITDASFYKGYIGMMVGERELPYGRVAFDNLRVSRE